jgi:aryl-alcohol dehydrogenase-like predicted oxidoreductase
MKTTTLGQMGLHVSRIAFGTWQLQPIESPEVIR